MSDNLERIPLMDDGEGVIGGRLKYISDVNDGYYVCSSHDKTKLYSFGCYENYMNIEIFIRDNCAGMTDEETLDALQAANLIVPV